MPVPPGDYSYPRASPDGTRISFEKGARGNRDIWTYDRRRMVQTRFTNGPTEDMLAVWSPDSSRIYFSSDRAGNFDIYSKPADGSTDARVELARPVFENPMLFAPDGELIVFEEFSNVSALNLDTGAVRPLLHRESIDVIQGLSADARWAVYESNEAGPQWEVFLRPYPDLAARREQVSVAGGRYPMWGLPGSNELYYVDLEGQMMAVPVEFEPDLSLGTPVKLFDTVRPTAGSGRPHGISAVDGRFLVTRFLPRQGTMLSTTTVSVVLNWLDELERQMAARRD